MKYILIFWLTGYPPFTAVEFDTLSACLKAGESITKVRDRRVEYICVPKGNP